MIIFTSFPDNRGNFFQVDLRLLQEGKTLDIDIRHLPKQDKISYLLVVSKTGPENKIVEPICHEVEGIANADFLEKLRAHLEWTNAHYHEREGLWKYFQGEGMAFMGTLLQHDYFINYGSIEWGIRSERHEKPVNSSEKSPEKVMLIKSFYIYTHHTGDRFTIEGGTLLPDIPAQADYETRTYQDFLSEVNASYAHG